MSYAFPRERPLTRGAFDLCDGPFILGSTQVQQYEDRWAAWVATAGIRYGKWHAGQVMNDTLGSANQLFTSGERPAKLSFCFDQDALPCLAIESAANTITVRKFVSGTPTSFVFTGKSPLLFYNGVLIQNTGIADVVCLYIKTAGDKIYARVQRDLFATEYVLNATLPATVAELRKTDYQRIAGSSYQFAWGLDNTGKQVTFRSSAYPPFPPAFTERPTMRVGFQTGLYFPTIIDAAAAIDKGTMRVAFNSGFYFPTVLFETPAVTKANLAVGFQTGAYPLVIVSDTQTTEKANLAVAFLSGNYPLVVQDGGDYLEKTNLTVGFQTGAYT